MFKILSTVMTVLALVALTASMSHVSAANDAAEAEVLKLLEENRAFHAVPEDVFEQLGWDLPDGGAQVKSLADAAPGGAFDPRKLEALAAERLGYQAKWHEVRYEVYGLEWDIPGLYLTPNNPLPGLPTIAIIHGGSANWYEFFLDPLNGPGLGQYLAQKANVLLITIPGNYRHGGWQGRNRLQDRIPGYVLDRSLSPEEAKVRNAVFTFQVVSEGVRRLIETATSGPVLVVGHSHRRRDPISTGGVPASRPAWEDCSLDGEAADLPPWTRWYRTRRWLSPRTPGGFEATRLCGNCVPAARMDTSGADTSGH